MRVRRGRVACRAPAVYGLGRVVAKEQTMGKYFLAWLLGVPAIVLVLIYFFFN